MGDEDEQRDSRIPLSQFAGAATLGIDQSLTTSAVFIPETDRITVARRSFAAFAA